MGVCPAAYFVLLQGTEFKLGLGVDPQVLESMFSK